MRTFEQLSEYEQKNARETVYQEYVAMIAEGLITFEGRLGNKIDTALKQVANSQDPSAAHRAIVEILGNRLHALTEVAVEDAIYDESGNIIREIA